MADRMHNKALVSNARELRKSMTDEERHLWYDLLRGYPEKFQRQKIIGNYIVDFYCAAAALAVELDGAQHFEEENMIHDAERTAFLEQYGLEVIRFSNKEIHENFRGVCEAIDLAVQRRKAERKKR